MQPGHQVSFYGEGEQEPGIESGDIIVTLKEKKDEKNEDLFKRKEDDLFYQHKISLVEALTGYSFYLKHLDDRILHIKSEKGDIIKPGDVKMVENEGMPIYRRPFDKGRLFIQFDVEFPKPEEVDDAKRAELLKILPVPPAPVPPPGEIEEVEAKTFDLSTTGTKRRKADGSGDSPMEDEEDEEGQQSGARRAQCMNCIM